MQVQVQHLEPFEEVTNCVVMQLPALLPLSPPPARFQTSSRNAIPRRPRCETLLDVFVNIRDDEMEHVKTMVACQNSTIAKDIAANASAAAAEAAAPAALPLAPPPALHTDPISIE